MKYVLDIRSLDTGSKVHEVEYWKYELLQENGKVFVPRNLTSHDFVMVRCTTHGYTDILTAVVCRNETLSACLYLLKEMKETE